MLRIEMQVSLCCEALVSEEKSQVKFVPVGAGSVLADGVAVFTTNTLLTDGMSPLVIVICENKKLHCASNARRNEINFFMV